MNITPTHVTFEQAKWIKDVIKSEAKYDKNGFLFHSKDYHSSGSKFNNSISAPEQWQVVEWLRVNHDIWVNVSIFQETNWEFMIGNVMTFDILGFCENFNSPQEAYSAAFDYILNNNLI